MKKICMDCHCLITTLGVRYSYPIPDETLKKEREQRDDISDGLCNGCRKERKRELAQYRAEKVTNKKQ